MIFLNLKRTLGHASKNRSGLRNKWVRKRKYSKHILPYVDTMANVWNTSMTHSYFLRNLTVQ